MYESVLILLSMNIFSRCKLTKLAIYLGIISNAIYIYKYKKYISGSRLAF